MLLEILLEVTLTQHEMEALHTINNMDDVVVWVLFEIGKLHLSYKVDHCLKLNVI